MDNKLVMIIGKIEPDEKVVRFNLEIHCSDCGKRVPGGMKASEKFYNSKEFEKEIGNFQKNYLCGICRDKKRKK